jgi:hypothetical protein
VIRTSSEVDNQSAENKASNEGDYAKGQHCKRKRRRNIRLMMEKTNSAETYHTELYSFGVKRRDLHSPKYRTPKILVRQTRKQRTAV